jgi:hypothetical protein
MKKVIGLSLIGLAIIVLGGSVFGIVGSSGMSNSNVLRGSVVAPSYAGGGTNPAPTVVADDQMIPGMITFKITPSTAANANIYNATHKGLYGVYINYQDKSIVGGSIQAQTSRSLPFNITVKNLWPNHNYDVTLSLRFNNNQKLVTRTLSVNTTYPQVVKWDALTDPFTVYRAR